MITYNILPGTTDVSVTIRIIDSTDGTPETGVVFNTAGIALEYRREGAASTAITEATLAGLTTAHTDGGFLHIGNGYYRLDLPDAACATGVAGVLVHGVVTGMVVIGCYIQLESFVNSIYTRLGAPAGASHAADLADIEGKVDDLETRLGTPSDFGSGTSTIAANLQDLADNGTATFDRSTDSLQALRDHIADGTNLTEAGGTGDHLTALATQASVNTVDDFLDTEVAAILAAVDTEVGAIKTVTDALPDAGALTSLATQASVNTIDDFLDTEMAATLAAVDTEVAAIKAKTDSLTFTVAGKVDANITHVIADPVVAASAKDTSWGGTA